MLLSLYEQQNMSVRELSEMVLHVQYENELALEAVECDIIKDRYIALYEGGIEALQEGVVDTVKKFLTTIKNAIVNAAKAIGKFFVGIFNKITGRGKKSKEVAAAVDQKFTKDTTVTIVPVTKESSDTPAVSVEVVSAEPVAASSTSSSSASSTSTPSASKPKQKKKAETRVTINTHAVTFIGNPGTFVTDIVKCIDRGYNEVKDLTGVAGQIMKELDTDVYRPVSRNFEALLNDLKKNTSVSTNATSATKAAINQQIAKVFDLPSSVAVVDYQNSSAMTEATIKHFLEKDSMYNKQVKLTVDELARMCDDHAKEVVDKLRVAQRRVDVLNNTALGCVNSALNGLNKYGSRGPEATQKAYSQYVSDLQKAVSMLNKYNAFSIDLARKSIVTADNVIESYNRILSGLLSAKAA